MAAVLVAAATAFVVSLLGTPLAIRGFTRLKFGQPIRIHTPQTHLVKRGTPTMGGVVFVVATLVAYVTGHVALSVLPAARNAEVGPTATALVLLGVFVFSGAIGFIDDFLKIRERNSAGLSERGKLVGQTLVGVGFGIVAVTAANADGRTVASTALSFIRDLDWLQLSTAGAVALFVLVVVGTTNGVNLTDGLDGLAAGASIMVLAGYGVVSFWQYRHWCADTAPGGYNASGTPYCYEVRDPLEVAMLAAAAAGALVGFLWWNAAPAKIIMGDTGAMAIGGLVAAMATATRTVLLLPIIAGLFVIVTMSLVIQRLSYKTTGRRVFRNSPLHHHFEMKGWSEVTVVIRFWIIAGILAATGLGIFYGDFLAATS